MENNKSIKVLNRNGFHAGKTHEVGEAEYKKARFLLKFDYDSDSVTEGLSNLKKSAELGYEPAIKEIENIKKYNRYPHARKMYKFVYGRKLV